MATNSTASVKCDDPATTEAPFGASAPILEITSSGAEESLSVWGLDVHYTDRGWETIFSAACPESTMPGSPTFIGIGVSDDGLRCGCSD